MEILLQITFPLLFSNVFSLCPRLNITGAIESEVNSRGQYPNNKKCIWNICTLTNHIFIIEFDRFDLARRWGPTCHDFVKITDQRNNKTIFHRCGSQNNPNIKSDSNRITIEFQTDNIQSNKTGFKLRWYSMGAPTADNKRTNVSIRSPISTLTISNTSVTIVSIHGGYRIKTFVTKRHATTPEPISLSRKIEIKNDVSRTRQLNLQTHPGVNDNIKTSAMTKLEDTSAQYITTTFMKDRTTALRTHLICNSNHETENSHAMSTKIGPRFLSTRTSGSGSKIDTFYANTETDTVTSNGDLETPTTKKYHNYDKNGNTNLYVIGIVLGGILIETVIVSVACTLCRKRKQKRWSVKTLSRTKDKTEGAQAWWSRPKSLSLSYNERISLGNLYSEINIQEMISFQNDEATTTNSKFNKCPYEEVIRRDGEYDHIGKHREKRKSFLDKLNVYGLHRISNIFKNN